MWRNKERAKLESFARSLAEFWFIYSNPIGNYSGAPRTARVSKSGRRNVGRKDAQKSRYYEAARLTYARFMGHLSSYRNWLILLNTSAPCVLT